MTGGWNSQIFKQFLNSTVVECWIAKPVPKSNPTRNNFFTARKYSFYESLSNFSRKKFSESYVIVQTAPEKITIAITISTFAVRLWILIYLHEVYKYLYIYNNVHVHFKIYCLWSHFLCLSQDWYKAWSTLCVLRELDVKSGCGLKDKYIKSWNNTFFLAGNHLNKPTDYGNSAKLAVLSRH